MRLHRRRELDWNIRWGDLARYNSEVSRGIIHTPEYAEKMAEKQARFDDLQRAEAEANGWIVIERRQG